MPPFGPRLYLLIGEGGDVSLEGGRGKGVGGVDAVGRGSGRG